MKELLLPESDILLDYLGICSSDFRLQFLSAISGLNASPSKGLFVDSCYAHCQTEMQETWLRDDSPVLGQTVRAYFFFYLHTLTLFIVEYIKVNFSYNSMPFVFPHNKYVLQTIAKAVGDWYFDRSPFKKIDCPYPCNPTCHNRVFDSNEHSE